MKFCNYSNTEHMYTIIHYNMNLFNSCNYFFWGGGDSASFRSSFSTTQQLNTNVYVFIFYFFSPGIPIGQQHLIWQSIELEDDYCLHDYSIHDGATLKLVLAMRGGPINTRRSKFLHVDQRNYFQ